MKITNEEIKKIIKEVMSEQEKFGKTSVTASDSVKTLKQRTKDASSQQGVDNRERGIIQQIETNLAKLADVADLKSGKVFSILRRLNQQIEIEIEKIQSKSGKDSE
jgi:predicted transcriptional regulator